MPLAADVRRNLLAESLRPLQVDQLIEGVGLAFEEVARVFAVGRHAVGPVFRRDREHRTMRRTEPEGDARHRVISRSERLPAPPEYVPAKTGGGRSPRK